MIRPVREPDRPAWMRIRASLWPEESPDDLTAELLAFLTDPAQAAFVAERDGELCGFIEASIRSCGEGCGHGPVGYIEGWYVALECRRQGVGRALVRAAEEWAAARGCRWMGSDALADNTLSHAAHAALGYRDAGHLVHFAKPLTEVSSTSRGLALLLLLETFTVVRLPPDEPLPAWAAGPFVSVTRTEEELSVICRAGSAPPGARQEPGWRCLRVAGTLDFALVGVLTSLVNPLAATGVSVFAVSTFDTDYLLVRESDLDRVKTALERAGHRFTPA